MRHEPVNEAFVEALRGTYEGGAPDSLLAGAFSALGASGPHPPDAREFPVLGYYVSADTQAFLLYVLSPGRFIRYEVMGDRTLTVAVPLHRISRVVEVTGRSEMLVTVELDADVVTEIAEYREGADHTDPARLLGRGVSKAVRTSYDLKATDARAGAMLTAFSLALRNSIGA